MAEPEKKASNEPRVALLAGASGFVGGALLGRLLEAADYARTHAVTRRPLPLDHARLANRILPFDQVEERLKGLRCDDAFCCIGGPLRGGNDAELRKVDVDQVLVFARAARASGAQRFVVVSREGASNDARGAAQRIKAEMESRLAQLQFASLHVLRPAVVLGWRPEPSLSQIASTLLMPLVNPLLGGGLARFRAISADDLAAAMVGAARSVRRGVCVHAGSALEALAASGRRTPKVG